MLARAYFIVGLIVLVLVGVLVSPNMAGYFASLWLIVGVGVAVLGFGYSKKLRSGKGQALIVIGWIWTGIAAVLAFNAAMMY